MTIPASVLTDLPAKDYDAIRKLVRTGDLALCSGTQIFSRAIRWVTGTPWSHIALIVRLDEIDRVIALEAVEKIGVRAVPLSRFVAEDSERHRPYPGDIIIARHSQFARKATPARLKAMNDFATDRLGAPFNGGEMIKIFARIAAGWFDRKLPRLIAPRDEYICSEYVAECLKRVGIEIPWDGLGFIAPNDFAADPKIKAIARVSRHPFRGKDGDHTDAPPAAALSAAQSAYPCRPMLRRLLLPILPLAWLALTASVPLAAGPTGRVLIRPVDPLTVDDDDFARHRDPAEWRDRKVLRIEFTEERASWRLWLIEARKHRDGPLWFVPHDDENAAFEAALVALDRYGGTLIAVDSGTVPGVDGIRRNRAVAYGDPVDPNRNFHDGLPVYAGTVLAGLSPGWPIVALHTNAPGLDPASSTCPTAPEDVGEGDVSIHICDPVYTTSPSKSLTWPFDDPDTLAFAPYRASATRSDAWCGDQLAAMDFNVIFERVVTSDGSLSNYTLFHHLPYLNLETRNRGLSPEGLANARDRLLAMIDRALHSCPSLK